MREYIRYATRTGMCNLSGTHRVPNNVGTYRSSRGIQKKAFGIPKAFLSG